MNIFTLKTQRTLKIIVLIIMSHFILTTITGYLISKKVSTQIGPIFQELFEKLSNKDTKEDDVDELVSTTRNKVGKVVDSWKPVSLIISFPVAIFIHPYIQKIQNKWFLTEVRNNKMFEEDITRWVRFIRMAIYLINSIAFGLLVFGIYKLFQQIKISRHSHII